MALYDSQSTSFELQGTRDSRHYFAKCMHEDHDDDNKHLPMGQLLQQQAQPTPELN